MVPGGNGRGMGHGWLRMSLAGVALAIAGVFPVAAHAITFAGPTNITVGSNPQDVVTGNFNGDADPDLAVVNQSSNSVSVLLGAAGAGFSAPASYTVGTTPLSSVTGDFDGDLDGDLAVINEATNDISVLVAGPGGIFTGPTSFPVGTTPQSAVVGNFNGDTDPDLAVVNEGSNNVSILVGGAGATFGAPTNFAVGGLPRSVAAGDFNGDTDPDLAVANEATNNISILVGAAGATFTGPTNFPVCSAPTWLASGQFNGDTDPDLAVVNELCHTVSVLTGGAGSSFSAATDFPVGNLPDAVAVGELTGDSDPDLVVANQGSDNMSVLVGGLGSAFIGPLNFAAGDGPTAAAVADFDADTDTDVAITNELANTVSILLNTPAGYPRPKGATPVLAALVPAYTKCTAPNRLHGPPALGGGSDDASCTPPAQTSGFLTVGTPDAGGGAANSNGTVRLDAVIGVPGPPDDSDIRVTVSLTDVRCKAGAAPCGTANAAGGADYTGELTPNAEIRVTDTFNGIAAGGGTADATGQDYLLGGTVQVPCTATASTAIGSSCGVSTTLNAIAGGTVLDGKRAVWQLGQVEVLDGGSDGEASTTPNGRFAVQGIFVP